MGRQVVHPALTQPEGLNSPMHDNGRYVKSRFARPHGYSPRSGSELDTSQRTRFMAAIKSSWVGCR